MSEEKAEEKATEPVQAVMAKPAKKVPAAKPMRRAATPAKGAPKKVSPRTVRGKIALYQKTAAQFRSAAHEMLQSGAADMQAGVRAIQSGIKQQMNKFKEGAAAFQASVAALQSSIVEQMKENQEYVKKFYG